MFQTLRRVWPSTYFAGVITFLSFVLPLPQNGKILNLGSPCALFATTGIPCPGCGLTRSFVAFAHGFFVDAWVWHPLGPPLFLVTIGYFVWSMHATWKRPPFRVSPRVQFGALGTLAALLAVFWGLRLAGTFPLPDSDERVARIVGIETEHLHVP